MNTTRIGICFGFFAAISASISFYFYKHPTQNLSIFPLDHYDQNISHWISPTNPNYDQPLISKAAQQAHFNDFYEHDFGGESPWDAKNMAEILKQKDFSAEVMKKLNQFDNQNKTPSEIQYGENFQASSEEWIQKIRNNIDLSQLNGLHYQANHRGITVQNLNARLLPTADPRFLSYRIAGEGYPFDNLQNSALWVGTPVYILAETKDHAWLLVQTPEYVSWVPSEGVRHVSAVFVEAWQHAAKKNLAAITRPQTGVFGSTGQFLTETYTGSVFPAKKIQQKTELLFPAATSGSNAKIQTVSVNQDDVVLMPWALTRHHMADVMQALIGRPYGWGGLYFYNDCSAELKSLFTPFGIWLPRASDEQAESGATVWDLSSASAKDRIQDLMQYGHPFLTIVYIGGHVVLYLGNYPNPRSAKHEPIAMTYQNVWGLKPASMDKRAIIGGSVLFPLLLKYPEDESLNSLASTHYFIISNLD